MEIRDWLSRQEVSHKQGMTIGPILQPSMEGFFDFLKKKRHNPKNDEKPNLKAENKDALKNNYLNDGWLSKQSYVEGPVSLGKETALLTDKGRKPKNMVELLERAVKQHRTQMEAHYKKVDQVIKRGRSIHDNILGKPNWKDNLTEATFMWVGEYTKLFDEPIEPVLKIDAGSLDSKKKSITSMSDVHDLAVNPYVTELPTLDKKGVKRAAELILELFELNDKELNTQMEHWVHFFGHVGTSPSISNPVPASNPWHSVLIKIDEFVNPGYTAFYYARDALVRAIAQLIDKSIK